MSREMSRRSFVKGAGAGAVALGVAAQAAPAAGVAAEAEAAQAPRYSFEVPPTPVDETNIVDTVDCDILVVGAGISGLCLATRAAELSQGADDIVLISASSKHVERGGSFHGVNTKVQQAYGIEYTPQTMGKLMKVENLCHGFRNDFRKWSRWIQNSAESMNWLIDKMTSYGAEVTLEDRKSVV